jgi:hypothetical protein
MSTWTNVTDTVLEPGQPIRSVDIIAIKNNILAVPAGAANAPRVQTAAIQDLAVTTAKIANNAVGVQKLLPPTAGNNVILLLLGNAVENGDSPGAYYDRRDAKAFFPDAHLSCTVLIPGVIRASFEHREFAGATRNARILKNGTVLANYTAPTSSSYTTRTLDITVVAGDLITFQKSGGGNNFWRNVRILSGNLTPAVA